MELKINLTDQAGSDLDEIKGYLVSKDPEAAERVRFRIEQAINTISFFPDIGQPTNRAGIRMVSVVRYPYRIYHSVSVDTVTVLHIRHTSRAVPYRDEI
jgi:toxin ParE1/3/4